MMNIEEFSERFEQIKNLGWVKSMRRGPTGIGQTLEQLLGLEENNIALPDLHEVELKSHRIGSTSMITLFTFNRKAWKMKPLEAIRKYG
ncbi:MAG: MvaI/BcnI family restriction endonuclease, partial [Aridibacter sp.]